MLELAKVNKELQAKLDSMDAATAVAANAQSPEVLKAAITEAVGPVIDTLTQSVTALAEEVKAIRAEKSDFSAEVGKASALLVAQITGQRPPIKVSEGDPATVSVFEQYLEIKKTDPTGAGKFWNDHRAELRKIV